MREAWLNWIVVFGLIGILLSTLGTHTFADPDMYHSMALFRSAVALGCLPTEDVFSYVPTVSPMIHHEWGTGALLYLLTVSAGLGATGLLILRYLLSAGVFIGCYLYARNEGTSIAVFAPLAILAMMLGGMGFTTIRAHLFSLFFLVILLLLLQEDRRGRRWWIVVWLPLHVVWINLHAGFVLGLGIVGLYTLERLIKEIFQRKSLCKAFWQIRHLMGVGLAMVLMVVLNPYGLKYIPHLWHALTLQRVIITEWRPIWDPANRNARIYVISVLGLYIMLIAYTAFKLKCRDMPNLLFLTAAACLSIFHVRYLSISAVTWICCVPAYIEKTELGAILRRIWTKRKGFLFVFWASCGFLGLFVAMRWQFWHLKIPTTAAEYEREGVPIYPVSAVDYLAKQNFKGNLMVPFVVGAYVSWRLYPAVKVSLDSRFEAAYPIEWAAEQADFYKAKDDWRKTLTRYPTDAVLVPRYSPIDKLLAQPATTLVEPIAAEWRRVYTDDGFSIFARSEIARNLPFVDNRGKPIVGSFP